MAEIYNKSDGDFSSIITLTPNQEKSFKKLQKAWKDCLKEKIVFTQVLDTLYAFDGNLIRSHVHDTLLSNSSVGVYLDDDMGTYNSLGITTPYVNATVLALTNKGKETFLSHDSQDYDENDSYYKEIVDKVVRKNVRKKSV
jgi:hypothetical protein